MSKGILEDDYALPQEVKDIYAYQLHITLR